VKVIEFKPRRQAYPGFSLALPWKISAVKRKKKYGKYSSKAATLFKKAGFLTIIELEGGYEAITL
jgi:uncharacterized protein YbaA (DUF1428 family)